MKRLALIPLALALSAGITACSSEPEWESGEQQRQAFAQFTCDKSQQIADGSTAFKAGARAQEKGSREDRLTALDVMQAALGATAIRTVPLTTTPNNDGVCEGWVWDWYLDEQEEDGLQDFTAERAAELGYL